MESGTINYTTRRKGICSKGVAQGKQDLRQEEVHPEGYTMADGVMQMGPKVVVEVTVHDWIEKIPLGGAGRQHLWKKYLDI